MNFREAIPRVMSLTCALVSTIHAEAPARVPSFEQLLPTQQEIGKAWLLAAPDAPVTSMRSGMDPVLTVPATAPNAADSVVVVECLGELAGDPAQLLSHWVVAGVLHVFDANLSGDYRQRTDAPVQGRPPTGGIIHKIASHSPNAQVF